MPSEKNIPDAVIKRLPKYYRYLTTLRQMGVSRISSNDLGNRMGLTASQVRQDFFCFDAKGLHGHGYDVDHLQSEISNILGYNIINNIIIIGAGNLGTALAKHTNFEKKGFKIVGIFDVSPQLVGKVIRKVRIMHLDDMREFLKSNHVDIAAITVPVANASEVAELVTSMGIKGLWNFTAADLKVPQDVVIENIQLSDSLIVLRYKLQQKKLI